MLWVLEFQEAVRACAMRPISRFKVHSLSLLFFGVFCLYPILFCSLQYIYKDMYHSYPSVCPLKRSGTTGNHIFYLISLMWSRKRVCLPIWFQHWALQKPGKLCPAQMWVGLPSPTHNLSIIQIWWTWLPLMLGPMAHNLSSIVNLIGTSRHFCFIAQSPQLCMANHRRTCPLLQV